MPTESKALAAFHDWYHALPQYASSDGPARGVIAAALVVLERMKCSFSLDVEDFLAPNRGQIRGASASAVQRILNDYGETRPYLREGGRTNRGTLGAIADMLLALSNAQLDEIEGATREHLLSTMQLYLVERIQEYHNRKRIEWVYDPAQSTWQVVATILAAAKQSGKEGPVAQYLIGAKLQLRFPDIEISNESYSTADVQLQRHGDFFVGQTAFHVTVQPFPAVYEKIKRNLQQGYRAYLLVPDRMLLAARQLAENAQVSNVAIESIETFVGQNVDEIAVFSNDKLKDNLKELLDLYNSRVDQTEIDKSYLIDLPTQF
ncbi:MAG: DUF4928 family protein [Armatimonadota bacterium]